MLGLIIEFANFRKYQFIFLICENLRNSRSEKLMFTP